MSKSQARPDISSNSARAIDAPQAAGRGGQSSVNFPEVMAGAPAAPRMTEVPVSATHLEVPSINTLVGGGAIAESSSISINSIELKNNPVAAINDVLSRGDAPVAAKSGDGQVNDAAAEVRQNKVTSIEVVAQDQNIDPSKRVSQADVRIKENGDVEFLHNPALNNKTNLVIEVERPQGQLGELKPEQQASLDAVVTQLAGRLMQRSADGGVDGSIVDAQGFLSEQVKTALKPEPTPEQSLPEATQQAIAKMQRFNTAGRGTIEPQQVSEMVPTRPADIQRMPDDTNERLSLQDVIARLANGNRTQSYEYVGEVRDGKLGVGRYMLTADLLWMSWSELLGDPPDPQLLAQLKKNPKLLAAFQALVAKLAKGEKPSAQEIKAGLPRELQEKLAGHLIDKFSKATGGDPGKTALAMQLGHVPTAAELARPENKSVLTAASRLYQISSAAMANPGQSLDWQNNGGDKLLLAAKQNVGRAVWAESGFSHELLQHGNVGCMATISRLCEVAGIKGVHAAVVDDGIAQLKARGYREVSTPKPGSIVRFMKGNEGWHIGVYAGNGQVIDNSSSARVLKQRALSTVYDSGNFTSMKYYDRA